MSSHNINDLENKYKSGQEMLDDVTEILANRAEKFSDAANNLRLAVIILGALAISRDAAAKIVGNWQESENYVIGFYAVVGMCTAIAGGMLATFKFESRAAELKVLAVAAQSAKEKTKTRWSKALYMENDKEKIEEKTEILEQQDDKTGEILGRPRLLLTFQEE
jgi:hypothetical protein